LSSIKGEESWEEGEEDPTDLDFGVVKEEEKNQ
jgi:hypothetical protein